MERSGRISQLTRDDGLSVWVNFANVLYVESVKLVDWNGRRGAAT